MCLVHSRRLFRNVSVTSLIRGGIHLNALYKLCMKPIYDASKCSLNQSSWGRGQFPRCPSINSHFKGGIFSKCPLEIAYETTQCFKNPNPQSQWFWGCFSQKCPLEMKHKPIYNGTKCRLKTSHLRGGISAKCPSRNYVWILYTIVQNFS